MDAQIADFSQDLHLAPNALFANRYEVVKLLGSGGMGNVCLVRDTLLENQLFALKVLLPGFQKQEKIKKRFIREAQLMRKVENPYVLRIFDVGEFESLPYFLMEYIPGDSLAERIKKQKFNLKNDLPLIKQLLEGIIAIHQVEIIHRDLKPTNILFTSSGYPKITDFGVSKIAESQLTTDHELLGTAHYMAPEVWLGKSISLRTDLYSLGVILYELISGRKPFNSELPATLMWMHLKNKPESPKLINSTIPFWLDELVLKLLEKNPDDRQKNGQEILSYIKLHENSNLESFTTKHLPQKQLTQKEQLKVAQALANSTDVRVKSHAKSKLLGGIFTAAMIMLVFGLLYWLVSDGIDSIQRMFSL